MPANGFIDLSGQRFGKLRVVSRAPNRGRRVVWYCECDCGGSKLALAEVLRRGEAQSCNCLRRNSHLKHGHTRGDGYKSQEFKAWAAAKQRCTNPNDPGYKRYGGRGIYMADEWLNDFPAFLRDMGPCPDGYAIDRIDNDGPYSASNCRWTTRLINNRNRSCSKHRRQSSSLETGASPCSESV